MTTMRELKFRAWDTELKKMLFDGDYWLPKDVLKWLGTNHPSEKECHPIHVTNRGVHFMRRLTNSIVWVEVHDDTHEPKSKSYYDDWEYERVAELPIMQYTGLKDKNGRAIYECDIITQGKGQGGFPPYDQERPRAVEFRNGCWCFNAGRYEYGDWIRFGFWIASNEGQNKLSQIEIVGNIYNNPELLEEIPD